MGDQGVGDDQAAGAQDADIARVRDLQIELMRGAGPGRRGQHPKAHGVVWAEFEVLDDVPDAVKIGLFGRPATYGAYIRFSNGSHDDDSQPDVHGMAIKLTGVPGRKILEAEADATTHDFILADKPVFFIRTAAEYVRFIEDFARTVPFGKKPLGFVAWLLLHHPLDVPILLRFPNQIQDSPLSAHYWSQVPYALGDRVCRYAVTPDPGNMLTPPTERGPDYLQAAMVEHLTSQGRPARFDFMVQVRDDAGPEVIDNPTVAWDVPPVRVATLTIPPQSFVTPEQMRFCEALSFTPWHALPEHRPLGEINAVRREVYVASSTLRHDVTQTRRAEPTGAEHLQFNAGAQV